jgi:tetratricopeptide (TPR) repeat protein
MSKEAEIRYQQGTAMLEAGRYTEAIRQLSEATMMAPKGSPVSIAAHLNLAKALLDSPDGNHRVNCETAVRNLKDLLSVCSKENAPDDYGQAHNLMGCAYRGFFESTDDQNYLEWAIEHFQEAVNALSTDSEAETFCSAAYNLAALYTYADIKGLNLGGGMPLFEARHLMERMLPNRGGNFCLG